MNVQSCAAWFRRHFAPIMMTFKDFPRVFQELCEPYPCCSGLVQMKEVLSCFGHAWAHLDKDKVDICCDEPAHSIGKPCS